MILLVTEIGEHKANPKRAAIGTVLETKLDRGRGPVATVLVQDGTLRVGDNIIAGPGRRPGARADRRSRPRPEAGGTVDAGRSARPRAAALTRRFVPVGDRSGEGAADRDVPSDAGEGTRARREGRSADARIAAGSSSPRAMSRSCRSSSRPTCRARPKCWRRRLSKLSDDKTKVKIIHSAVGAINESDVLLAAASNAIIIGFNVRPDRNAADVPSARRSTFAITRSSTT